MDPIKRTKLYTETISGIQNRIPQLVEQYNLAEQSGDVEAMQQLKAQIDSDSQKIDYFDKAIQGQNQLKRMQEGVSEDSAGAILERSARNAIGSILSGVKFVDDFVDQMKNDVWQSMGYTPSEYQKAEWEKYQQAIKGNVLERPSDKIAGAGKIILDKVSKESQLANESRPYKGSVWDALLEGDVSSATSNAAKGFGDSFFGSLSMVGLPMLSTMGLSQQSVDEAKKEGSVTADDYIAGALKGSFELAFENLFGTGKALKELVKKVGREQAIEQTERVVKAGLKEWAKKSGTTISEEVLGEGLTQLMSNVVDKSMGKNIGYWDGVPDAMLIGGFGGMTQGTATTILSHYIDRAKVKEYEAKKAQAQQLQEQALEAPSQVVAEAIENEAEKINEEADAIAEQQNVIGQNANPETVQQIEEGNAQIDELEAALETASPEVADAISNQIEQISNYVLTLVEQAQVEAFNNAKIKEETTDATKIGEIEQSSQSEYQGTDGQKQRGQENRVNQEGPIPQTKVKAGDSNIPIESGQVEEVVSEPAYFVYDYDANDFLPAENAKKVSLNSDREFFYVKNNNGFYEIFDAETGQSLNANNTFKKLSDSKDFVNNKLQDETFLKTLLGAGKRYGISPSFAKQKEKTIDTLFPDDIVIVSLKDGTKEEMSFRGFNKDKAVVYSRKIGQLSVDKSQLEIKPQNENKTKTNGKELLEGVREKGNQDQGGKEGSEGRYQVQNASIQQ